jgi:hypothetical protein
VFGLGWFVLNERKSKQETLDHYRIIPDSPNVANQKALQEWPRNTGEGGFSGEAM